LLREKAFSAERDTITHLYNYGLASSGETVKHHEQGHPEAAPDTRAIIKRHPTLPITYYEIAIPAAALFSVTGMAQFMPSHSFGVGVAVNDGDLGECMREEARGSRSRSRCYCYWCCWC
jgi:hypothetical protein